MPAQMRVCELVGCGKRFRVKVPWQRFCCRDHKWSFNSAKRPAKRRRIHTRACEYEPCGVIFYAMRSDARFCCNKHAMAAWHSKNKKLKERPLRRCKNERCDNLFRPRASSHRCCSARCRLALFNDRTQKKRLDYARRWKLENPEKVREMRARERQNYKKVRAFVRAAIKHGLFQPGDLR